MAKKSQKSPAGDNPEETPEVRETVPAAPAADGGDDQGEVDQGAAEAQAHFGIGDVGGENVEAAAAEEFDEQEKPKTLAEASDVYLAEVKADMEAAGRRGTDDPLYGQICGEMARREAAQDAPATPSNIPLVVDCGRNPSPLGKGVTEVDCGYTPGKAGHAHQVTFHPDGRATVHDAKGQAIGKYHGRHHETVAALAADGIDWQQLPAKKGTPVEGGGGGGGGN